MQRDWDPEELEMMDRPQPVSAELERDLENLRGLNQHFGSYSLITRFLRRWMKPGCSYRVADLCTGAGDIPRMMVNWALKRNVCLEIDAVDLHPATLEIAKRNSTGYPQIRFTQADILTFSPSGSPYDFVFCTLALHHFSEENAVEILRHCRELSCGHVLVSDLERSRLTSALVWLVSATVYRDPMTQYDARLSARRAFSFLELQSIAQRAGWNSFGHRRFLPCRQAVWV
jgi:2-polyprenyl-3-methyl-5-hydroxy-6-metoxy-1,4-benzoquinol methylase